MKIVEITSIHYSPQQITLHFHLLNPGEDKQSINAFGYVFTYQLNRKEAWNSFISHFKEVHGKFRVIDFAKWRNRFIHGKKEPNLIFTPKTNTWYDAFPNLAIVVDYPCKDIRHSTIYHIPASIYQIIMRLNDCCGWTREQIADWLDTLDVELNLSVGDVNAEV